MLQLIFHKDNDPVLNSSITPCFCSEEFVAPEQYLVCPRALGFKLD
jgi:hypothetical protein